MEEPRGDMPPTGEQIHIPRPSLLPVLVTVGVTLALIGVTLGIVFIVIGLLIAVPAVVAWIRAAREELAELPPGH
jgi:hypothetical protein